MVEIASIIILGIFAQWISWKIRVPAILPLIIIGLLVGPLSTLWSADGGKWIEPIFNPGTGNGLFPGESLFYFVSLAIGIILFEGGLTLKRKEISDIGPAIVKLITVGSVVTFIGAGLATHYIMHLSWPISFLFAGLIIVTGPTVIAPILQNVPLNKNVSTVLKWEGILIDPIGALVAVLVFEFIRSADGGVAFTSHALIKFFQITLIGFGMGFLSALGLYQLIKHELVPRFLLNVFTLAAVLAVFVFADVLAHEAGLLSVVVMGMVLGNLDVPRFKEILYFKESISLLLISILFILLAANINMSDLELITGNRGSLILFVFVALILRPLSVFASTQNCGLSVREQLFISWVGPRGIVAAGIASLFGITLKKSGFPGAEYITPLVFMIVLGTVILNATTARLVARLLGVIQKESNGVLFFGSNQATRLIARYLIAHKRSVAIVDNNENNVNKALSEGINSFTANIFTEEMADNFELLDMGYLVALTANDSVNDFAVKKYQKIFGERGTYRVMTPEEMKLEKATLPNGLFSYTDDYLNLSEVARDYPEILETPVKDINELERCADRMTLQKHIIPLFIRSGNDIQVLPRDVSKLTVGPGTVLVYMGQTFAPEDKPSLTELA